MTKDHAMEEREQEQQRKQQKQQREPVGQPPDDRDSTVGRVPDMETEKPGRKRDEH